MLLSLIVLSNQIVICQSYKENIIQIHEEIELENYFEIDMVNEEEKVGFETYESLGVTKEEFWYLTYLVFCESQLESSLGQELVVLTALSRTQDSRFPNDIISVINSPYQFGGRWMDSWGSYTQANVDNVISALVRFRDGELDDIEKQILFFHNPEVDSEKYAEKYGLKILMVVGGHTFLGYDE
jgi:hypothetical protein